MVYSTPGWEYSPQELNPQFAAKLVPQPPPVPLSREEQQALVLYMERAGLWSEGRKEELANHLHALTGKLGREGVERILAHATWLRDS